MNSETKKEFLQKYKLDNYSRAVPARQFSGNTAVLAEYCDPVDSRKVPRVTEDNDYSSDPEKRYAQPQDAIEVNKIKKPKPKIDPSEVDDEDVYDLAKQTAEDNALPQKKPSPKPRSAKHSTLQHQNSAPTSPGGDADPTDVSRKNDLKMSPGSGTKAHLHKKRPGKKVVEIEYEVASEIRLTKLGEPSSGRSQDKASSKTSINPDKYVQLTSHPTPQYTKVVKTPDSSLNSSPVAPGSTSPQSLPHSMSQALASPAVAEDAYEEPWDLKMKRLKQEQEKKGKKLAKRSDKLAGIPKTPAVYENAWDIPNQQQKFEKQTNYARSLSQVSEVDVFHDAVENFSEQKVDNGAAGTGDTDQTPTGELKPLPQNTYEDAWDLKNSLLEQKIREMQLQASAIYEQPWDSSKQQKQLHAKLCGNNSVPVTTNEHHKLVKQRSSSEVQDTVLEETDSNATLSRGKHHSFGEASGKARGHGCNIGQRINPMIPLGSQNWYHGNISREDAEKMLCVCKEGSYIVRISSDRRSYSLSIKSSRQYIHVQIDQRTNDDGSICYILGKNSKEFCTIPEMIDYYTHHRVPLKGAEHITLLHPVECKWS